MIHRTYYRRQIGREAAIGDVGEDPAQAAAEVTVVVVVVVVVGAQQDKKQVSA